MKSQRYFPIAAAASVLTLGVMIGFSSSLAHAETSSTKILVVDIQKIIDESIIGKAEKGNVQAQLKKNEARLEVLKKDLARTQGELQKQGGVLSAAALEERREAFLKQEREFRRALEDHREELARKNSVAIEKVVKEIEVVVNQLAKEGDASFVLERDKRFVLFADESLDITQKVIKILDDKKVGKS